MSDNIAQKNLIKKQPTFPSRKVKWLRVQGGFSQTAAAVEMGVSRETFTRWERGVLVIPPAKLQKLRRIVHASMADFVPDALEPAELVYDSDGYPAGSSLKVKKALEDEITSRGLSDDEEEAALEAAWNAWDERLIALEKEEYPAREEQRARILETGLRRHVEPLAARAAAVEKAMAGWWVTNAPFLEEVAARFR